jgi:hypothetical protein
MIWRETEVDTVREGVWTSILRERQVVAHEIGHEFGLGHGQMGLMEGELNDGNNFGSHSINLIRSRVRSPGE